MEVSEDELIAALRANPGGCAPRGRIAEMFDTLKVSEDELKRQMKKLGF